MKNNKYLNATDNMLSNFDRVMRQLRRRPKGSRYIHRGTHRLLTTVSADPGLSTSELVKVLGIRRASLNEMLLRLENEGMIKRNRDSNDKRVYLVYLEQAGTDYLTHSQKARSKKNQGISTILTSEEINKLAYLAGKLADGFEEINTEIENDK